MADLLAVLVPLVNPNENECLLARLAVKEGQRVKAGELLAVFETTKSTFDLLAEKDGIVLGINAAEGDLLKTNERLCYLAERADQPLPQPKTEAKKTAIHDLPSELRITQPALALAREHGIDLSAFPAGELITEKRIKDLIALPATEIDPTTLIIYGGGGHAKSLIDLIRAEGKYSIAGVLDDALPAGSRVLDISVLGNGSMLAELRKKGIGLAINAVGGIGSITPRLQVYERLRLAGFRCPTVIHPQVYIEPTAVVSEGGQFFFNAYIGSEAKIGFGCIINTGAILSHDCILGDFVNISPGAILAGAVMVKERSLIGMGVTINLNVTVGAGARVGNSAVVKADVPDNGIVRAGTIWPQEQAG
jgi:sugar O-acyltransferase (sialic acid O-acetyltransferase NeuD family)